jgi:hypothetical protein
MSSPGGLAGEYTLHPGVTTSITGHRPVVGQGLLARLLSGQSGEQVEHTLAALFTLCAHAHQHTARLVLNAASLSHHAALPEPCARLLALETARDHLRSMALDWPRQLVGASHVNFVSKGALDWLEDCPLSLSKSGQGQTQAQVTQSLLALRRWLEECVLQQKVNDWLAHHQCASVLAHWCEVNAESLMPARCLAAWQASASHLGLGLRALDLLDTDPQRQASNFQELTRAMSAQLDFAQHPTWRGQSFETGAWTRLRQRGRTVNSPVNAWSRMTSRWFDLLEIAAFDLADDAAPVLVSGAMPLVDGQALAWCEMARGLLLHWVQLDAQGQVADYRIVAPTEWNFHPQGALAQALTALAPHDSLRARALAGAYDACVECHIQASPSPL